MDSASKSSLVKILQKEFVRRKLIQYFESKGYDNFLVNPYPPNLMDIMERVEELGGLIEVKYSLRDVNIQNNNIKVEWNLFILGNQRAFLGCTTHGSLIDLETSINNKVPYDGPISVKNLVEWIVDSLGSSNKLSEIYDAYSESQKDSPVSALSGTNKTIPNFKKIS